MKSIIILCLFGVAAVAFAKPYEQYTDRYDDINLDEILGNPRLLIPYVKCMLDQGRCTPEGKELKSHIAEALRQDCAKCTKVQRDGTRRVIHHLIQHEAKYWAELKAKYDPTGKYSAKYENELKAAAA